MVRCCNCFGIHEGTGEMCPHCGYVEGDNGKELYYLKPGTRLNSRYTVGRAVGAGGFGITYLGWDESLNMVVAIKEFFPVSMVMRGVGETQVSVYSDKKNSEYDQELENFVEEARIMSLFANSTNVRNTYNFFKENGTAYIVMEYLDGFTLKEYMKKLGRRLNEKESLVIIEQVLKGLEEIHSQGIIHRDIAPDNIWLSNDGKVKIIDFGAAIRRKDSNAKAQPILKPGFAPPEQYCENGKIGPWTDIYAVGATAYYMLTGRLPLEGSDRDKEDTLLPPNALTSVTEPVSNAVMRAMAIRQELRYRTAGEFLDELGKEKVRSLEQELKSRKRKRFALIASIVLILLTATAAGIYFGRIRNTIFDETIHVWIEACEEEEDTNEKLDAYRELIAGFNEGFPQIKVELEAVEANVLADGWFESRTDCPDVVETGSTAAARLINAEKLDFLLANQGEKLIDVINEACEDGFRQLPVGFSVSMNYFDKSQPGGKKVASNTADYYELQERLPGQYELEKAGTGTIRIGCRFSLYKNSVNRRKAAAAFIEYLLTDSAQDILHIQNRSGYLPVNETVFDIYLETYPELSYLDDVIDDYEF